MVTWPDNRQKRCTAPGVHVKTPQFEPQSHQEMPKVFMHRDAKTLPKLLWIAGLSDSWDFWELKPTQMKPTQMKYMIFWDAASASASATWNHICNKGY